MLAYHTTLTVRVPRGAAGDLEGGVRDVLETVDGVDAVAVEALEGVRPGALDLHVDASATVDFDDAVDEPELRLREGFGVVDVRE